MDNIQFWLYVAFGIIYFVVKQMRKKKAAEEAMSQEGEEAPPPYRKPVSFDDLLREFTQEKEETTADPEPPRRVEPVVMPEARPIKRLDKDDHSHRRFADEESRKVYQDSIKQAEGFDLAFARDAKFETKLKRRQEEEEEETSFGSEILASLQDTEQAKKAMILSEIFNRKY